MTAKKLQELTEKQGQKVIRDFHKKIAEYDPAIDDTSGWLVVNIDNTTQKDDRSKMIEALESIGLKTAKMTTSASEVIISTKMLKIDPTALARKFIEFNMKEEAQATFPPDIFEKALEDTPTHVVFSKQSHPRVKTHSNAGRNQS